MDSDTTARRIPRDYPPFLYIPCLAHVRETAGAEAVYRTTKDGRTALLVYSALIHRRRSAV